MTKSVVEGFRWRAPEVIAEKACPETGRPFRCAVAERLPGGRIYLPSRRVAGAMAMKGMNRMNMKRWLYRVA